MSKKRCCRRLGNRTAAAAADLDLVHRLDRRRLDGHAHEEHLVGHVEHLAGSTCSRTLKPMSLAIVTTESRVMPEKGSTAHRRRVDDAVAHDEDVLAAAFAQIAIGVERDPLGVALDRLV